MKTVAFHHIIDKNVGDFWCTPTHYYHFGHHIVRDLFEPTPEADALIVGGGKTLRKSIDRINDFADGVKPTIVWGSSLSGVNKHSIHYRYFKEIVNLVGIRDFNLTKHWDFLPCVSCKHTVFDNAREPEHDVVFFKHGGKSSGIDFPDHIPTLSNNETTMEEVISFIASGKTVVSNSYHGNYWAMLLGKKVLCLPFNDKFDGFEIPPKMTTKAEWQNDIQHATEYAGAGLLEKYRRLNDQFYDKVMTLIDS